MKRVTLVICLSLLAPTFISTSLAASLQEPRRSGSATSATAATNSTTENVIWHPDGVTWDDWVRCHGMPCDAWQRQQRKMQILNDLLGVNDMLGDYEDIRNSSAPASVSLFQNCIVFTEEQLDVIIDSMTSTGEGRKKRGLITLSPASKWTSPISFMFDGTHSSSDQNIIRNGIQHWMANTCIRFTEIPTQSKYSGEQLVFTIGTRGSGECSSNVGRVYNGINQMIKLDSACMYQFGTPVHEIGHALGRVHEQMRTDRDNWITLQNNIKPGIVNYQIYPNLNNLGVPYDLGSVMQYSPYSGDSTDGNPTMYAKEPLYQMNMGQRVGLSFNDIKIINLAYCANTCPNPLPQPCLRGGYVDPKNCAQCRCPDGFAGTYCQLIAPSVNAVCGGVINVVAGQPQIVKSPGYDSPKYYQSYSECSWWLKAPAGQQLQLVFAGDFGMYSLTGACQHWAEIKYKVDLGLSGGRFCGFNLPKVTVISESNEMMIVFKSNASAPNGYQRGFQAIITVFPATGSVLPTPVSRPASTVTTTATPVQQDANKQPKVVSNIAPFLVWQCSFETSSADVLCGMKQDQTTDQFDWTVSQSPTPSDPTGPDSAYDGRYYIYIEASEPRILNDTARLYFPNLSSTYSGPACLDFYYHLYGFHINTLTIAQTTNSLVSTLWKRTGQVGNIWLHSSIDINIQSNTQLQMIASRGIEYSGDIGVDKLTIKSGLCSYT